MGNNGQPKLKVHFNVRVSLCKTGIKRKLVRKLETDVEM